MHYTDVKIVQLCICAFGMCKLLKNYSKFYNMIYNIYIIYHINYEFSLFALISFSKCTIAQCTIKEQIKKQTVYKREPLIIVTNGSYSEIRFSEFLRSDYFYGSPNSV